MKSGGRRVLGGIAVLLVAGALVWLYYHREPSYQGRMLTECLTIIAGAEHVEEETEPLRSEEAKAAVRAIGAKAIPSLVRMLQTRDGWLKRKLRELDEKSEFVNLEWREAWETHELAGAGFAALQEDAAPAIPALVAMLDDPELCVGAVGVLALIGPPGRPALLAAAHHSSPNVRIYVAGELVERPSDSPDELPTLLALTRDSSEKVRLRTFSVLPYDKRFLALPDAMSVLLRGINETNFLNDFSGSRVLDALRDMGENARPAVPRLVELVNTRTTRWSLRSLSTLAVIAPESALPLLHQWLTNTSPGTRPISLRVAANCGAAARELLPGIKVLESDPDANLAALATFARSAIQDGLTEFGRTDGVICRGPRDRKRVALVLVGDEFADSLQPMFASVAERGLKASVFFTTNFFARQEITGFTKQRVRQDQTLGLLYLGFLLKLSPEPVSGWRNRYQMEYYYSANVGQLSENQNSIKSAGTSFHGPPLLLTTAQENRRTLARLSRDAQMRLVSPTPGTLSTEDTTAEGAANFVSSQTILDSILDFERKEPDGLNGFLLMFHLGSGPKRADKFHTRFGELLDALRARGYEFFRVDELLKVE